MRVIGALALCAALLVPAATASEATHNTIRRVQLDRDPPLEKLIIEKVSANRCGAPFACSRLILEDGSRRVALSTLQQRGRPSNYKWLIASVRAVDLTGDGIRDVMWKQETVGATGTSPVLFAVSSWTGRTARRIFTLQVHLRPARGYEYSLPVAVRVKRVDAGVSELWTRELLYRSGDSDCCPSSVRRRRYRWNGRRIGLVPGSTRVVPAAGR